MKCNCYVQHLGEEIRFSLHFGAHGIDCNVYRESLDPIDRLNDEEARLELSKPRMAPFAHPFGGINPE